MDNQDAIAILKAKISANALRRIRDAADEISRPKILHTQYLGDRAVQQLGQEPIENAVILNNAANAIGDALMPLAKGQPLQRFDSVNQDDGVGTARRALLDYAANRDGSSIIRLRTGEQEPANDPLKGTPRGRNPLPKDYAPPYGCVPVGGGSKNCIWIPNATSPDGYQSHGSAVINQDGLELWLHCKNGVVPPQNLGCDFLSLSRWKCQDGVCVEDPNGIYSTQAECEAARIPVSFTGGQCVGVAYLASGTRYLQFAGNAPEISTSSDTGIGPILGISAVWIKATPTNDHSFYLEIIFSNKTVQLGGRGFNRIFPDNLFVYELLSTAVSRVDGLPDDCGDRFTCP